MKELGGGSSPMEMWNRWGFRVEETGFIMGFVSFAFAMKK